MRAAPAPATAPAHRRTASRPPPAGRVIVAEANSVNQIVATRLLRARGFDVEFAMDGHRVLELHGRSPYDAIFIDCHMPAQDGFATTREIRAREGSGRHTPIIAMTANRMADNTERCLAAGMDYCGGRPITPGVLDYLVGTVFVHASPPDARPLHVEQVGAAGGLQL